MPVSGEKFWQLLSESGLLKDVEVARMRNADAAKQLTSGPQLAAWLVSQLALTPYQAEVLAAGRSGPFDYGEYAVEGRLDGPGRRHSFKATHRTTRHPVQLDFLAPTAGESEVALARRVESARQHCQVRHPGLTDCYVLEQLADYKFLVLESPTGIPLDQFIAQQGPVEPARAIFWLGQLALGLEALHRAKLCHGRLHPGNILIERDGARLVRNPLRHPVPLQSPVGGHSTNWTLPYSYATPELSAWDRWPDASSDLYGAGGVLHFLLTGEPPFSGETSSEIVKQNMSVAPPSIASLAGPEIDGLLQGLLAKSAKSRLGSAAELSQRLTTVGLPSQVTCQPPEEAPTFPAFFAATQARQTRVDEEVAVRAADPAFADRTAEDMPPVVESESFLQLRMQEEDAGLGTRWLMPVISVCLALLTLYIGNMLMQPVNGPSPIADPDVNVATISQVDSTNVRPSANPNRSNRPSNSESVTENPSVVIEQPINSRFHVAADDGQQLWAPATSGEAHTFGYGQQGGQLFLAVRPSEILAQPQGSLVLQSLGPEFERLKTGWEKKYLVPFESVEQLIVVISANATTRPVAVSDILLKPGLKRPDGWTGEAVENTTAGPIFSKNDMACLVPPGMAQRRFVVGPKKLIKEIGERGGEIPILRREFEALRSYSDADAHFTLLLSPSYLLRDGRELVAPTYASLPKAMDTFFGDGVHGLMFTAHLSETSAFGELRLATTLEVQKPLQKSLPDKIAKLSPLVEDYVANLQRLDLHWRQIALRYDNMLRFLSKQSRVGIEDRQLVINTHLPAVAAHNLVLATELALAAGVSDTAPAETIATTPPKLKSIEQVLIQRTSLNIPQQSLEFSMRDLQEDVNENTPGLPFPFKIEIAGADLQLDGITRNQQIRNFSGENQRIADLLTGLVMRANPVTTVKKANEPNQKLVWIIERPEGRENPPYVLITTRKAAESKGYRLPKVFRIE